MQVSATINEETISWESLAPNFHLDEVSLRGLRCLNPSVGNSPFWRLLGEMLLPIVLIAAVCAVICLKGLYVLVLRPYLCKTSSTEGMHQRCLLSLSLSLTFSLCGVNCILACDDNTAAEQRLETVSSRLLSTNVHSDDEIDSYEPTPQGDTDTPGLDVHDIVTPEPPPEDGIIFSHSHRRALEGSRSMEYDPSPIETSHLLEKAHISSKHGHGSHHHHHHHHGDVELNNMSMLAKKCAQALLFLLFATYFDLTNRILAVPYCSTHPHHKPAPIAALLLG